MKQITLIDDGFGCSMKTTNVNKDKETSFGKIYSKYVRSSKAARILETHDIISPQQPILRAHYSSISSDRSIIEQTPKTLNGFNISKDIVLVDPLANFEKPSEVQQKMIEQVDRLPFKGSFCLNAACGSGKTVAGLSIIKRLHCKTLIISARNAVNDQWKSEIQKYFPQLKIADDKLPKKESDQSDIYIFTPQYLMNHIDVEDLKFLKVDLIIYDELHSLLSNKFSKTLVLGMFMKLNKLYDRLPYMVGLTATIPNVKDKHYVKIMKIFGRPLKTNDTIRLIPIKYTDVRNVVPNSFRGLFDENYNPLNDFSAIDVLTDFVLKNKQRKFVSQFGSMVDKRLKTISIPKLSNVSDFDFSDRINVQNKFLIITGSIPSSVYGALVACRKFKSNVLLIRAASEKDIYIDHEEFEFVDYQFDHTITLETLKSDIKSGKLPAHLCHYKDYLDRTTIIVGTYHRLLEGFNCPDITDGICTKFIWSPLSRVQLLGRIRRSRPLDKTQPMIRQFIMNSGKITSDLKNPRRISKPKVTYESDFEKSLFEIENYNMSNNIIDKIALRKIISMKLGKDFEIVKIPKKSVDEFYSESYIEVHELLTVDSEMKSNPEIVKKIEKYKNYIKTQYC